jgi:hypothetical protein
MPSGLFFSKREKKYSVWPAEHTRVNPSHAGTNPIIHDLVSVKPSDTKWNRVTPKWHQVTPSETEWGQSETKWHQVKPSDTKWHQVKPSETEWRNTESEWNRVTPSDTEWHQVNLSDTKWTQVTPSASSSEAEPRVQQKHQSVSTKTTVPKHTWSLKHTLHTSGSTVCENTPEYARTKTKTRDTL